MNRIGEIIGALIGGAIVFAFLIGMYIYVPITFVKTFFFESTDEPVFYILGGLTIIVVIWLFSQYPEAKKNLTKCPHGIRGGATNNTCPNCISEKEAKLNEEQEKQRLLKLQKSAEEFRRREIEYLKVKQYRKLDYLYALTPQEFEDVVTEMFRKLGFQVTQTPYSNDRGKDGIAYKNGKKSLIESKKYSSENKVGRPPLQKFFAAMHEEKAQKGFFVTTGYFAETAYEYAKENNIDLINGTRLVALMREAYPEANDDSVEVMCPTCGDIVKFDLASSVTSKYCRTGHQVQNNISYEDLKSKPPATRYKKKYKRY